MFKSIINAIQSLTGSTPSRYQAKNRLQLVLAHDRAGVNPDLMDQMRKEILEVVSRYIDIDLEAMEFTIQSSDRQTSLSANLPIRKIKRSNIPSTTSEIAPNPPEVTSTPAEITPTPSEN
jgi:cell division topological specificity factor